jgi:alpha-mannosidase
VTFGQPLASAEECNLIEEVERPAEFEGNRLTFTLAPYEIKTFNVRF